ncbi:MAG TPA: hypothetical protein VGD58_20660 [Herpetosiphonaceae bacterium]
MKGFTLGLLVAAGVAGLWAAQRSRTQRQIPAALPGAQRATSRNIPNVTARAASTSEDSIDPKMVITPRADIDPKIVIKPKGNIDPKIVVNPPPPRKPGEPNVKPSHEV